MENLDIIKEYCKRTNIDLDWLAHQSWVTLHLHESNLTVEMVEDLYVGMVSGVYMNLGSGKEPELMEGVGPAPEDRHTPDAYIRLWLELTSFAKEAFPFEEWLLTYPESEEWVTFITESRRLEKQMANDPDKWFMGFRKKLSQIQEEKND